MNDPNKVIDVNLSSLLSLKAELLRKKSEVSETKASRTAKEEYEANKTSVPLPRDDPVKTTRKSKKPSNDESIEKKSEEYEDTSLLEKSRKVLEAKTKFYEKMAKSGGQQFSDENCLVDFSNKFNDPSIVNSRSQDHISDDNTESSSDDDDEADEDWVEYTDCLGRTRKCLRNDLESAKKRDAELAASMPERLDQNKANWMIDKPEMDDDNDTIGPLPPESLLSDLNSMLSKHDEQRANWERTELENLDKKDVHYQDVFFDEARQHGVGYYAFSTDIEERRKQQKELDEARERTMEEQSRRDALRAQREKIISERVLAAKNRQRARLGLPPLEPADLEPPPKKETKEERKARKKEEKMKRKLEKLEKEREAERQQYIRPWDESKTGVHPTASEAKNDKDDEWSYKPDRTVMSQEEWNEHKRAERVSEFAPPSQTQPVPKPKRTQFSSNSAANDYRQMPPPPDRNFSTFQSSKNVFNRRNTEESSQSNETSDRNGTCIPPPQDLDYSLPPKKSKASDDLERSIEAGLKFLRENSDKGTFSTKSSWTAKADY